MTSSFGLFWPGKEDALKQASLPAKASASKASPTQTDLSHPDGNILYAGDNLDALKSLAAHSPASVDVITPAGTFYTAIITVTAVNTVRRITANGMHSGCR